jgi:aspartate racemase
LIDPWLRSKLAHKKQGKAVHKNKQQKKIIALIGGMGPESGLKLHSYLLSQAQKFKPIERDQDHLDVVHLSFGSQIPDRTDFLVGKSSDNPADAVFDQFLVLQDMARYYKRKFLAIIACNTFHAAPIYNRLLKRIDEASVKEVELLNLIQQATTHIKDNLPKTTKIGILSTTGEKQQKIYKSALEDAGYSAIQTDEEMQKVLHNCIYDIKASSSLSAACETIIDEILRKFEQQGVKAVILGCTELSLVTDTIEWPGEIINPLQIAADNLIKNVLQVSS